MTSPPKPPAMQILVLIVTVALLTACGGSVRQVKGEPPLVGLDGLTRSNDDLILNISIRNVNDSRLEVSGLTLRLELDGEPAGETRDRSGRLSIAPRGREVVRIQATADTTAHEQLQRLATGERTNIPWRLEIAIDDIHRNTQPTEVRGFLHAVPGQPDRFR